MNFFRALFRRLRSRGTPEPVADTESEWKPNPAVRRAVFVRKIFVLAIACVVILTGVLAGLVIVNHRKNTQTVYTTPEPLPEPEKKLTAPPYSALDPVSGDWGISPKQLADRMNITLDAVGARANIITNFSEYPQLNEFRHTFTPAVSLFGEADERGNVRRVALLFDPVKNRADYDVAFAVMRAIIASLDPALTREDIAKMTEQLGLELYDVPALRRAEVRYKKFVLRVWSVTGSAFVFTASSDSPGSP